MRNCATPLPGLVYRPLQCFGLTPATQHTTRYSLTRYLLPNFVIPLIHNDFIIIGLIIFYSQYNLHVNCFWLPDIYIWTVAYPGFFSGGVQQIQLRTEDRERGFGGGSPLVRGSGGSCNLVQEISFHIVNFS
jgi:hypothetical protein